MKSDILDLDTFIGGQRKLNLSGFSEIEKAMTIQDFNKKYAGHPVYTNEALTEFSKAIKQEADRLEKGGESKAHILEKAKADISGLKKLSLITSRGLIDVWVGPKDETIEKGRISEALGYGAKQITFKKTGKEIKDKIEGISDSINTKIATLKGEMAALVTKIGKLPDQELGSWERNAPGCDELKRYPWECCRYEDQSSRSYNLSASDVPSEHKCASSKEEAENCSKYNSLLEQLCSCYADKDRCDTFSRNVEEKREYELDLYQLSSFGF